MDNCGVESLITCAAFQSTLDRYTLADIALSLHDFPQVPTPRRKTGDSFFAEQSGFCLLLRNDGGAPMPDDGALQERIAAMKPKFHDDMTMDAIMREWPDTIRVVLDHGLLCVGCPIASFHTPADAAKEHQMDETRLIHDLVGAMKG